MNVYGTHVFRWWKMIGLTAFARVIEFGCYAERTSRIKLDVEAPS